MKTKAERQVQYELERQANLTFEEAHTGAGEEFGLYWLFANQDVVHYLWGHGFDVSDPVIKAVVSIAVRLTLKSVKRELRNQHLLPYVEGEEKDA